MARRLRRLAWMAALAALAPSSAQAWKPTTHVYLAQEAWADAADGRVTIELLDPATGARTPLGEFEVDPRLRDAIRQQPLAYFAGVLGPDAYPDMITGQMRVHPPGEGAPGDPDLNAYGAGTEPWLARLWTLAFTTEPSPEVRAFAAGYLTHAAGDYFAHTYVNARTGGIFALGPNGLKHYMLEGYLGQRTPDLMPIDGLDAYAYFGKFDLPPTLVRVIATQLADLPTSDPREQNKAMSLPRDFLELSASVRQLLREYDATEARLRAPLGGLGDEIAQAHRTLDWACDLTKNTGCPVPGVAIDACPAPLPVARANPAACVAVAAYLGTIEPLAGPALAPWQAFTATVGPLAMLARRWVHNIDEGLLKWVETNHRFARAVFMNPRGTDLAAGLKEWQDFAPIAAGMLVGIDGDVLRKLQEGLAIAARPFEHLEEVRADAHARHLKLLFGVTPDELATKFASPHAAIDLLFGAGTQAAINRDLGLPTSADDDFARYPFSGIARFATKDFAPAYDTVVLAKLVLLSPAGLQALYAALAAAAGGAAPIVDVGAAIPPNVMLGWGKTIDGSTQWAHDMPLAAEQCRLFVRLFRPIAAPGRGPNHPGEPTDECGAPTAPVTAPAIVPARQPITVDARYLTVEGGASVALRYNRLVRLRVTHGAILARCAAQPDDSCTVSYGTPVFAEDTDVVITAADPVDASGGLTTTIHVRAPLAVRVASPLAARGAPDLVALSGTIDAGGRVLLAVAPTVPVRWSLRGPGQLGAPREALALAQRRLAQGAKLAKLGRSFARDQAARLRCRPGAPCRAPTTAALRTRERAVAEARDAQAETELAIEALARTYVAPAAVVTTTPVTIRVDTDDGRHAELTLQVRPARPPIAVAPVTVAPGAEVRIVADPPLPVAWEVPAGSPGEMAPTTAALAAVRDHLRSNAAVFAPTAAPRIAPPRSPRPRPLPSPAAPTAPPRPAAPAIAPTGQAPPAPRPAVDLLRLLDADPRARAPFEQLAAARATYRAPTTITTPTTVTLRGAVLDGTGRTVTATVTIRP